MAFIIALIVYAKTKHDMGMVWVGALLVDCMAFFSLSEIFK